jgi:hydrogenase maturation protease
LSQVGSRTGRLIIGIGNPSRGDDALGPLAIERLEALNLPDMELLTDFQLQVEFLLDMEGREEIIFIDASVTGDEPFAFIPVAARCDRSHTTHALAPAAVLAAFESHYRRPPPPAFTLAIRAYAFELGEGLSSMAANNLDAATAFLAAHLAGARRPQP